MILSRVAAASLVLLVVLAGAVPAQAITTRNVTLLSNRNDYPAPPGTSHINYSACWGYVHGDGREYAIIGVGNGHPNNLGPQGAAIYNVTDPTNPYQVGFIPGPPSQWREMKSYRNWIYIVTEGTGAPNVGLQIVRMTNPESPLLVGTYTTNFIRSHTVSVDTARALLICNGTRSSNAATGMRILSIANPEAPVELATWPPIGAYVPPNPDTLYHHDSVPVGNRLYASSIYGGIMRVFDISNPAAPSLIARWSYAGGFSHNAWPDASGNVLYVTDEVNGQPLKVFDISNLAQPVLVNTLTSNPTAIVHNVHAKDPALYLANYTEGIRVLDISDPRHPAEFAWADSWPGASQGFDGVWEVYPYFPSGTVIASDRSTGLYVYSIQRDYGLLRVEVETTAPSFGAFCSDDACCCAPGPCTCDHGADATAAPAEGVKVHLTSTGDSLTTSSDGVAVFAPDPGPHLLLARKFGYFDATAAPTLLAGAQATVSMALKPRPSHPFSGVVRNSIGVPLEGAEVNLVYTPVHLHTNATGAYSGAAIPDDVYRVEVRRPGHVPIGLTRQIGPGPTTGDFWLFPAASYDPAESLGGWLVGAPGDNAIAGLWVNVEPFGTGAPQLGPARLHRGVSLASASGTRAGRPREPELFHEGHNEEDGVMPGEIQPELDRTPPPGTRCFVTGQGSNPQSIGQADVDGGRTSLTSPRLDCTGLAEPTIGYWHWFYGASDWYGDWLAAFISNNDGASWTPVDTTRGTHNHWMEKTIRVADYVTPTALVRVRFEAADTQGETVVEAGIDDLALYDGLLAPLDPGPAPAPARLAFQRPRPNPASGPVRLAIDVPAAGELAVDVLDVQGRLVKSLHRGAARPGTLALEWDGTASDGRAAGAGLFFVRARGLGAEAMTRVVRVR